MGGFVGVILVYLLDRWVNFRVIARIAVVLLPFKAIISGSQPLYIVFAAGNSPKQ